MNIEKQNVSLELSKQLKEAGYPQEDNYFIWARQKHETNITLWNPEEIQYHKTNYFIETYAAPTVAELGEMIGNNCNEWAQGWNDSGCFWQFRFGNRGCGNMIEGIGNSFHALDSNTEADARAKMWLYLKKVSKEKK